MSKENKEITDEDINKLCDNMQDLNKIGIPFTNFYLIFGIAIKIIILCVFFINTLKKCYFVVKYIVYC